MLITVAVQAVNAWHDEIHASSDHPRTRQRQGRSKSLVLLSAADVERVRFQRSQTCRRIRSVTVVSLISAEASIPCRSGFLPSPERQG